MSAGLHEREAELSALAAALAGTVAGEGSLIVVEGQAGIGKTRLLAAARDRARAAGMRVLFARGTELESGVAFGVVRQLLDPLVLAGVDAPFEGAAASARPLFGAAPENAGDENEDVLPRLHGLYWLLGGLAHDRPAVLLVDDIQWADAPSLHLLAYLAPRLEGLPLVVVAATRPVADSPEPLLARIVADPGARVLRPRPLTQAAVAARAAEVMGAEPDADFAAACHAASRGNPFLVGELLRELAARGLAPTGEASAAVGGVAPDGVAAAVLVRLAGMPASARAVAEAVAVLGDGGTTADAARLAGLDGDAAGTGVTALVHGGILETGSRLAFVHPMVGAAVYRALPPPERHGLHRHAAALAAARGAEPEAVAAHLLAAEPAGDPAAVATLRAAAARAVALGVPGSALVYLERALAEPPAPEQRSAVLMELGTAAGRAGSAGAVERLEQAIELAANPHERALAGLELARVVKYAAGSAGALPTLERCAAESGDPALRELIEVELLGMAHLSLPARLHLRTRIDSLSAPPAGATGPLAALTCAALAFEAARSGRSADECGALAQRAAAAAGPGDDPGAYFALLLAGTAALWADHTDEAQRMYAGLTAMARRTGSAKPISGAAALRSWLHLRRGDLADAEADARFALDLAREVHGIEPLLYLARAVTVHTAIERTRDETVLRAMLDELSGDDPDSLPFPNVLHARARLRAVLGHPAAALEDLLLAGRRHAAWNATCPAIVPWRSEAALLRRELGDETGAVELAEEEVRLARGFGAPGPLGIALRARALVRPREARVEGLEEAVGVLEASRARLALARAVLDLGAARRRAGERSASREPLRRAVELAVRCGAERLAAAAREELLASGARPRRVALQGEAALTPGERRVAGLAARGRTNRQIAQELYVTEKTVEGHLARAYDKLGIRSRTELPQALGSGSPGQSETTV